MPKRGDLGQKNAARRFRAAVCFCGMGGVEIFVAEGY